MTEDAEKDNIFPIKNLIENYSTIMAIFAKYEVGHPFLYRSNTAQFVGKMLFIFTTPLRETRKLYDELEPYFGFAFRLLNLSALDRHEQRALSFPQTHSVLLTPDLFPLSLETRVKEIFGGLWGTSHAELIIATQEELRKNTRIAKEQLDEVVLKSASHQKIGGLPSLFSQQHESIFITRLIIQHISFSFEMLFSFGQMLETPSTLRQLCLSHNALTEEQALLLQASFESNHTLTALDISHNKIGKAAMYFGYLLVTHTTLESLDIGNNDIETNIAEAFECGVTHNKTLTHLGLSHCFRGKWDEWEVVLRKTASNQTLTSLDISNNGITSQQLSTLTDFLQSLKLHSLVLHGNSYTAQDLTILISLIGTQATLKTFFLDIPGAVIQRDPFNPYYKEHYGYRDLLPEMPNSALKKLTSRSEDFYRPYCFHPCFYSFMHAIQGNTSLRHIVFNMDTFTPSTPKLCLKYLKQNTTLEKIEFLERNADTKETKKFNALYRKKRNKIIDRRKAFIYTLLSLNNLSLWQALPRDIKLLIFHMLFINKAFVFGKSYDQVIGCTGFIFSHAREARILVKTGQKVIVVEKEIAPRKYSFDFFKAAEGKAPVILVAHKNMPLAIFKKRLI